MQSQENSKVSALDFPLFKKVRFINSKKEGIAKSRRSDGELVINLFYWNKLKESHKVYVLAHEEGHILYNTVDELLADEHASKRYFEIPGKYKISESVKALSEHLNRKNPVHIARAWAQYQRALKHDWEHNKNKKAYRSHYETVDEIKSRL